MKSKLNLLQRMSYATAAALLLVAVAYPAFSPSLVSATQLFSRSITLSDSGPSGGTITTGVGSGTNVTYKVGFTTFAAASSVVIDFCSNDPIIGDTCTAPTAMSVAGTTIGVDAASDAGNITAAGWTVTSSDAGNPNIKLALGSGSAVGIGAQSFTLTGITNSSSTGTFYARIYTYANASYGTYTGVTTPGNFVDYGGIALSTNQIITITARVQEQLSFCISGANPTLWVTTNDCADAQAAVPPALILGHGSPTAILDSTATDTGTVYSQISTNATFGAAIRMINSNSTCGGLSADGGTTCDIPANPAGTNVPGLMPFGTAAFGLFVTDGALGINGVGSVTADDNYHDAVADNPLLFGMDNETFNDPGSITGTYGDIVAAATDPMYRVNNSYTFAATASLTTPAGIYTANMDLVATGTF